MPRIRSKPEPKNLTQEWMPKTKKVKPSRNPPPGSRETLATTEHLRQAYLPPVLNGRHRRTMKTLNREPSSRHRTACATGTHHYSPVGRYLVGARGDPVGTVDPDGLDLQRPRVRSHNCIQHRLS